MTRLYTRVLTQEMADRVLRTADNLDCPASFDLSKRSGKYTVIVEGENAKIVASKFPTLTFDDRRWEAADAR